MRERLGLGDRRVVLCVAAKRPHKNQELLVRAAERLPADVVIVLAGHPEPYDRELRSLAATLGVAEKVIFADYVPPNDLEALWDMAACAAFPDARRGLWPAHDRGAPARHSRRVFGSARPARGGR